MLLAFDCWDLTSPPIPRRTLLFPLEPIGIGTPFAESLTSYISRLAEVHAVTVSDLVGYVLAKCALCDGPIVSVRARDYRMGSGFHPGIHAINGLAEDARRWVAAAETATGRTGLRFLTLTPLKQAFCKQFLFRKVQAWCPACFADRRRDGLPLYLPLAWNLRMVEVCARHGCLLEDTCPDCGKQFGPLDARARTGYCSRCAYWLGSPASSRQQLSQERSYDDELWLATATGDVLASMPDFEGDFLWDILRENITAVIKQAANGNQRVFSDLTKFPASAVYGWVAGAHRPRPDQLFRICRQLRVPVVELLRRRGTWTIPAEIAAAGLAAGRRGVWRDAPEILKAALLNAVKENPPPSLAHVAQRLSYRTCAPLKRLDPKTCRQITLRYQALRRRLRGREKSVSEQIDTRLRESLALERPIPVARIAAEFGYQTTCVLEARFPNLCRAIARKEIEIRQMRHAYLRAGLISAISEDPPPAIATAAKRLACSHAYLATYFPHECQQLVEARKSWRLKQREAIQRRIEEAVAEMPGASVPEVCRATGVRQMFLYRHFPALYKRIASAFITRRNALREQKRAALRRDVRQAVAELMQRGAQPHVKSVAPFLSKEAGRDWRRIQQEIGRAMQKRAVKAEA